MEDTSNKILPEDIASCLEWIQRQQVTLEQIEYGKNKADVQNSLRIHQSKINNINDYEKKITKVLNNHEGEPDMSPLKNSYDNLKHLAKKKLKCVEEILQIANLEESFGSLTTTIADQATLLVASSANDMSNVQKANFVGLPHASQSCILAVKNNWNWLTRLVRCTDVHLKHVAEYHQFYHDISEYESWLPSELKKVQCLMTTDGLKGTREDANKLLVEIKAALSIFLTWQGKTDNIFEKAKRIVPVHYRREKNGYNRPVTSLCAYKTNEVEIQEGEELTLLDNTDEQSWLVQTRQHVQCRVPSIVCLIPPPDPNAVNVALRLRLQLLGVWTGEVKRIGKTVIYFLLLVFRQWTFEEEEVLKALPDDQKIALAKMCGMIETSLLQYWEHYPEFIRLQKRFSHLQALLKMDGDPKYRNSEMGKALIVQIGVVEELVKRYKDIWSYWETLKILVEVCRHGELILICDKWEELKFIDSLELLKRWHIGLDSTVKTVSDSDAGFKKQDIILPPVEVEEETILHEEVNALESEVENNDEADAEVYNVETAMETAEAEHISSAEQEESKTFVITGVVVPGGEEVISLSEAISRDIIDQTRGTYVNRAADIDVPIPVAMNAGWIKVEYTSTKKSAEKRRDIGLITIKIQRESRPYTIRAVKDVATEKMFSVDDAVADGLIDFNQNIYRNRMENSSITIADALDSGLLEVEIDDDTVVSEPSVESKTYAIYAVVDQMSKKRIAFREAVDRGLIDPETGAYFHNVQQEQIYVGDAIKRGFIKASVVNDPSTIDIASENKVVIEKLQKKLSAIKAVNAFRKVVDNN